MNDLIQSNIVCQQRTSKSRQFVLMSPNKYNPLIIKLPYNENKANKLFNISNKLVELNAPLVVVPIGQFKYEDYIVFIFPNLNVGKNIEYEDFTDKLTPVPYKKLIRTNLVKLGDYILTDKVWLHKYYPNIVLSLVYIYILGVGDTGFSNILVNIDDKKVYIIDFEENRNTYRDDELFYLSGRPSKKKAELFLPHVLHYYSYIADIVENIDFDNKELKDKAVNLLRKYSEGNKEFNILDLNKQNIGNYDEYLYEILNINNFGKMKSGPIYNAITYSGYKVDEMTSGLQKYIRRGNRDKALMCAFELYRMNEIECKAVVTNLYNRLAVIAAEDICVANLPLVLYVLNITNNKNTNPNILANIVISLCESRKSRLGSHVFAVYLRNEGMKMAEEMGYSIDDKLTKEDKNRNISNWVDNDHIKLKYFIAAILNRLDNNDFKAFIWLRYYMDYVGLWDKEGKKREVLKIKQVSRKTLPMYPLIESLTNNKILLKANNVLSEKRPILVLMMLIRYYKLDDKVGSNGDKINEEELNNLMNGDYILELDDFVYDMHTNKGRKMGKDHKIFLKEGSKVNNEDDKYIIEDFKYIYENRLD